MARRMDPGSRQPSPEEMGARKPAKGRVLKVMFADAKGDAVGAASQQLPEDDFRSLYGSDLQEPPFSLEQLVFLAEQHPIHTACMEQKALDVIGEGWEWNSTKDDGPSDDTKQRDELDRWFRGLVDPRRDETMQEILLNAMNDFETCGFGLIELARDPSGKLKYVYPMPAHTVRFARDGIRVCQIRQGKRVWFKRWMPQDERVVGMNNGTVYESRKAATSAAPGNEVLVIKKPARRSTWYGIPGYIPALGWITLAVIARDDNILFFENHREPRWAVILSNLDEDPNLEEDLKQAFQVDLKQPHRNLIIPIEGPGKIDFQQLGDLTKQDMSFDKLHGRADDYILGSHRVPADRIGLTRTGALGGDVAIDSTRVYKEAVVQPTQAILEARMQRLIATEGPAAAATPEDEGVAGQSGGWLWECVELDLTEESADTTWATTNFQAGIIMLNEARKKIDVPELPQGDERGDKFITELGMMAQQSMSPGPPGGGAGDEGGASITLPDGSTQSVSAEQLAALGIDAAQFNNTGNQGSGEPA